MAAEDHARLKGAPMPAYIFRFPANLASLPVSVYSLVGGVRGSVAATGTTGSDGIFTATLSVGDYLAVVKYLGSETGVREGLSRAPSADAPVTLDDLNDSASDATAALRAAFAPLDTAATVVGPYQMLAADSTIQASAASRLDTASTTSGSAVVTDTAAVSGDVGKLVYSYAGAGVPAGTTVLSVVVGTSFTMSANSTATVAGQVMVGGSFKVTLPTAPTVGKDYTVRNSGTSGLVTIIDSGGTAYADLAPGDSATLISDGATWRTA